MIQHFIIVMLKQKWVMLGNSGGVAAAVLMANVWAQFGPTVSPFGR